MTDETGDADTDGTDGGTQSNGAVAEAHRSDRVVELLEALTRGEKRVLIQGAVDPDGIATGYVPPIERLGIPGFSLVDGPMGIRAVTSTAFPATVSLAASWDPDLAERFGETIGTEARGANQDALLAPGVNVARVPQCGRNFEYYSEDPALTAACSTATIEGVQSAGVMATVKHYVANNQETDRHTVSAEIGERALRELYLPAFEAAVTDADVGMVMAAYNRINGTHATEHRRLLTEILREEWGFSGVVVSDWWATTDGPDAALAGLDLDMPGMPVYEWQEHGSRLLDLLDALPDGAWFPKRSIAELLTAPWQPENPNPHVLEESHFGDELTAAIEDGDVTEADLDRMVGRILGQYERFGLLDAAAGEDPRPEGAIDEPAHRELAREIAERGTVLLENDDVLPLDPASLDSVAIIGPNADEAKVGGGGSSEVDAVRSTAPAAGLRDALGDDVDVSVERGIDRIEMEGFVESPLPELPIGRSQGPKIADAERAAGAADVAIVIAQDDAREGADREFALPGDQNELIERVAAVADRTVVVLKTSGAVAMPWRESVDAIVEAWYPGQADGEAVGNVLCGDADPSGRLPVTFGAAPDDYPANTEERYPGRAGSVEYDEGVFVGYRQFDDAEIEPIYPFGHGESYAEFEYGELSVELEEGAGGNSGRRGPHATATVTVENVADRVGREVVQCYLAPPGDAVDRPPRELVAFEAVELAAGESRTVELSLDRREFAYYDVGAAAWTVEDGEHDLHVGRSSRDLRSTTTLRIGE